MNKKEIIISTLIIFALSGIILIFYIYSAPKAYVAFVIDDWGYNRQHVDLIGQIKKPITISILPNLRYSKEIAEAVRKTDRVHDVILHLPLESKSNEAAEINTIRCDMEEDEIISLLKDAIKSVPGIIGVSNHQGSLATEDERVMRIVLGELKKRKLFFLDSLTSPNSVCPKIARDIRLKYRERDVFLDLTDQTDIEHFRVYIQKQIRELASVAMMKGSAIGVGHNKRVTLEVIKESIPELEKKGIKIVPLKRLVR